MKLFLLCHISVFGQRFIWSCCQLLPLCCKQLGASQCKFNGPYLYQWPMFLLLYVYLQLSHFCNDSQHSRLCHLFSCLLHVNMIKQRRVLLKGLLVNLRGSGRNTAEQRECLQFVLCSLIFKLSIQLANLIFFFFCSPYQCFIYFFDFCFAGITLKPIYLLDKTIKIF